MVLFKRCLCCSLYTGSWIFGLVITILVMGRIGTGFHEVWGVQYLNALTATGLHDLIYISLAWDIVFLGTCILMLLGLAKCGPPHGGTSWIFAWCVTMVISILAEVACRVYLLVTLAQIHRLKTSNIIHAGFFGLRMLVYIAGLVCVIAYYQKKTYTAKRREIGDRIRRTSRKKSPKLVKYPDTSASNKSLSDASTLQIRPPPPYYEPPSYEGIQREQPGRRGQRLGQAFSVSAPELDVDLPTSDRPYVIHRKEEVHGYYSSKHLN